MGTEARLRILQLLLSAHPDGLVVGEIQQELDIPNSTLSHHLDKLKGRRFGECSPRKHVFALHRQQRCAAGTAQVPLCRMLHAQPGTKARIHRSTL
jgi:DNA-binding IclR family transcriptional regulator